MFREDLYIRPGSEGGCFHTNSTNHKIVSSNFVFHTTCDDVDFFKKFGLIRETEMLQLLLDQNVEVDWRAWA